jgi:hypothetical protein
MLRVVLLVACCNVARTGVMPKDNIAVGVVLEMLPDRQQVFVTNAHLTWDPIFKDVKVIQSVMLLHEVQKKITEFKKPGGRCINYPFFNTCVPTRGPHVLYTVFTLLHGSLLPSSLKDSIHFPLYPALVRAVGSCGQSCLFPSGLTRLLAVLHGESHGSGNTGRPSVSLS